MKAKHAASALALIIISTQTNTLLSPAKHHEAIQPLGALGRAFPAAPSKTAQHITVQALVDVAVGGEVV